MAGSEIKVAITSDNSGLKRGLSSSESSLKNFGRKTAKYAAIAGAAAAVGLAKLGAASIKAASDAQQSLGGTEAVFGKFARGVIDSSNKASDAVGLSANKYRESANIIGSLLKNEGLQQRKLAGETDKLVKTGADLAAVYGGDVKQSVDALASAFKGEFDPLQNYGITLKQSMINTEALSVANVKSTSEFNKLSSAQKLAAQRQATMNLLMKQAKGTRGQYQKQLGTLAEQEQRLGAKWDDLKVKIGDALLPATTAFVKVLNDKLMPALSKLSDKYLPTISKATTKWLTGLDGSSMKDFGNTLKGVDWDSVSKGASDLASTASQLKGALANLSLETVNNTITVFGTVVGFAADHVSVLAKALPILLAGFAAYKTAQLVNNTVGKDSLIGFALQLAATRQLTIANRELALAVREVNIAQGQSTSAARSVAGNVKGLGLAARGAAGLAGIGGLAAASSTSNKALSVLGNTASGALLGFSAGGPIGAAVGGVAGLMLGLATNTDTASAAAKQSKVSWDGLKSTLDEVSGATTAATKAFIYDKLQRAGAFEALEKEGVSRREAVNAIVGEAGARRKVLGVLAQNDRAYRADVQNLANLKTARFEANQELNKNPTLENKSRVDALDAEIEAQEKSNASEKRRIKTLKDGIGTVKADTKAMQQRGAALIDQRELSKQLGSSFGKGLKRKIVTEFTTTGIPNTVQQIASLATKFKLTPKQIKTVINLSHVDATLKDVKRIQKSFRDTSRSKMDSGPFVNSVKRAGQAGQNAASSGGKNVGHALSQGVAAGIAERAAAAATAAANMVIRAVFAAHQAADAHSPSRKTQKLGHKMGDGLAKGMRQSHKKVATAGGKLVDAALKGMTNGLDGVNGAIDKLNALIRKRITGKGDAVRENAIIKRYAKTYAALRLNGKAQDAINTKLEDQKSKLADLVQQQKDYAAAIKDSVVAYGSVIALGEGTGFGSLDQLIEQMKVRVANAKTYAALITSLQKSGLNQTTIQQLLDAGVEGGLGTAQTIASGGAAAIKQINDLTTQLTSTGTGLGSAMGSAFYDAGIKAAQGLVDGLNKQQAALDAAATQMAAALAKAVKRALGIKSPSSVFREIGDQTVKGLSIGLDDTYVKRSGEQLAASLQKGFGQPDLSAAVATGPYGNSSTTITVQLTAQQVSQLERGRSIQLDLDAYRSVGGRSTASTT